MKRIVGLTLLLHGEPGDIEHLVRLLTPAVVDPNELAELGRLMRVNLRSIRAVEEDR